MRKRTEFRIGNFKMMTQDEYIKQFNEEDTVGWDCIDNELKKLYGDQQERHYGTIIKYMLGGNDPIDGSSIYDQNEQEFHRHIISYGMSELYYNPEQAGKEFSKWGFEFTFRIIPFADDDDMDNTKNEPQWAMNLMQNLARYVFDSGNYFDTYHFIPCNGTIRADTNTKIVGVAFVPDTQLNKLDTPHGEVLFLQMVGLTQKELDWLFEDPKRSRCEELINKMRVDNPLLITDLNRTKEYV